MAGKCARTGKFHRARAGDGGVRYVAAGRLAGVAGGAALAGRDARGKVSREREGIEEAADSGRGGADGRELCGSGGDSGSASELPAPADSESGAERRNTGSVATAREKIGRRGVGELHPRYADNP